MTNFILWDAWKYFENVFSFARAFAQFMRSQRAIYSDVSILARSTCCCCCKLFDYLFRVFFVAVVFCCRVSCHRWYIWIGCAFFSPPVSWTSALHFAAQYFRLHQTIIHKPFSSAACMVQFFFRIIWNFVDTAKKNCVFGLKIIC